MSAKHVTEQVWVLQVREDDIYLVAADDGTTIMKLCRADRGSDLLLAGYIAGIQVRRLKENP